MELPKSYKCAMCKNWCIIVTSGNKPDDNEICEGCYTESVKSFLDLYEKVPWYKKLLKLR